MLALPCSTISQASSDRHTTLRSSHSAGETLSLDSQSVVALHSNRGVSRHGVCMPTTAAGCSSVDHLGRKSSYSSPDNYWVYHPVEHSSTARSSTPTPTPTTHTYHATAASCATGPAAIAHSTATQTECPVSAGDQPVRSHRGGTD